MNRKAIAGWGRSASTWRHHFVAAGILLRPCLVRSLSGARLTQEKAACGGCRAPHRRFSW